MLILRILTPFLLLFTAVLAVPVPPNRLNEKFIEPVDEHGLEKRAPSYRQRLNLCKDQVLQHWGWVLHTNDYKTGPGYVERWRTLYIVQAGAEEMRAEAPEWANSKGVAREASAQIMLKALQNHGICSGY
jgi:hypothetical protein